MFGRRIKDSLSSVPGHPTWRKMRKARELGMAKLKVMNLEKLNSRPNKTLAPINPGQTVMVQNQTGSKPQRWERTGTVIETLPHRQYTIKMDGSDRVSLRNRKFLKPITPLQSDQQRPTTSTWSKLPPTLDNLDIAEESAPATPEPARETTTSPQAPSGTLPTPRRTKTAVPRRITVRVTAPDVGSTIIERKDLGRKETDLILPTTSERQPRRSSRSKTQPARLGMESYDCSETL